MELFISLGLILVTAISFRFYFYKLKKRHKKDLNETYDNLKKLELEKNPDEAIIYIGKIIASPYVDMKKMDYTKKCIEKLNTSSSFYKEIEELKMKWTNKNNEHKSRYYGPDGTQ